jgi:hypothetical protein
VASDGHDCAQLTNYVEGRIRPLTVEPNSYNYSKRNLRGAVGMFGPKRYAAIYSDFEDKSQWLASMFARMTRKEFAACVEFSFTQLDSAAEAEDIIEFSRVKGLLLAIAHKKLQSSYFEDDLTVEQRVVSRNIATSYYELAKAFYPLDQQEAIEEAWLSSLDYGEQCGYRRRVIFTLLSSHMVFRDLDRGRDCVSWAVTTI